MLFDGEALGENSKTAATATFYGTIASAPVKAAGLLATKAFAAKLAFSTTTLAFQLALFGVIYRYAVRCDGSDSVNIGIVAMFSAARALSSIQAATTSWNSDTGLQLAVYFGESALAFGAAAVAVEYAWDKGWCRPLSFLDAYGFESYLDEPYRYGSSDRRDRNFDRRDRNFDRRDRRDRGGLYYSDVDRATQRLGRVVPSNTAYGPYRDAYGPRRR